MRKGVPHSAMGRAKKVGASLVDTKNCRGQRGSGGRWGKWQEVRSQSNEKEVAGHVGPYSPSQKLGLSFKRAGKPLKSLNRYNRSIHMVP